jgi:hypothetical protein
MGVQSYGLLVESTSSLERDRVDQSQDVLRALDVMHDHRV